MKTVKAVAPYYHKGGINFKHKPYEAWISLGGKTAKTHYPCRALHGLAYRYELPLLGKNKKEARLRFVQPYSLFFDSFPDYAQYEIIPFFWDVWPENFEKTFTWLAKHDIKTAIFTSSQVAAMVQAKFPRMNVLAVTEGIDVETYSKGKQLKDREIDFLEYGREIDHVVKYSIEDKIKYVRGKRNGKPIFSQQELIETLANSKVVAAYTKKWTNPEQAGEIDTLTQRYWECMLSGCIMIGHAPKELLDLIGYNPVIEVDRENQDGQLMNVLADIADYQDLVDRNRNSAIKYGDWKYSMQKVINFLQNKGYNIIGG